MFIEPNATASNHAELQNYKFRTIDEIMQV